MNSAAITSLSAARADCLHLLGFEHVEIAGVRDADLLGKFGGVLRDPATPLGVLQESEEEHERLLGGPPGHPLEQHPAEFINRVSTRAAALLDFDGAAGASATGIAMTCEQPDDNCSAKRGRTGSPHLLLLGRVTNE